MAGMSINIVIEAAQGSDTQSLREHEEPLYRLRSRPLSVNTHKWGSIAVLHLQALEWDSNGELAPNDRFVLLNTLMPQCVPEAQLELIAMMERLPMAVEMPTAC